MDSNEVKEGGRIYRGNINDNVFVRDWETFRESWKDSNFIKTWSSLSPQDLKQQIIASFNELLKDDKKLCYLLPDSLKKQYRDKMVEALSTPQFRDFLDYQEEPLFLGKKKQLIVYKKRTSLVQYLSKYRLPAHYKKDFADPLSKMYTEYLKLLIDRNMKISQEAPIEQIKKCTESLENFGEGVWKKTIDGLRKLLVEILEDFKRQPNKREIPFPAMNSYMTNFLKKIAEESDLFVCNRYANVSEQDQYKDILVTKDSRDFSDPSFDDESLSEKSFMKSDSEEQIGEQKQSYTIEPPKEINEIIIMKFLHDSVVCEVSLFNFGKKCPTQYLEIEQIAPRETEEQKNYLQKVEVEQKNLEYSVQLPIMNQGMATYAVRAVNQVGKSPAKLVRVFHREEKRENPLVDKRVYLLGESKEGLIADLNQEDNKMILTTNQNWEKFPFGCHDFSVSSCATICSSDGSVASWGKMYIDANDLPDGNDNDNEEEEEDEIKDLEFVKPEQFVIEKPSLILSDNFIRQVSCGEGYCLMSDCLGRAWSFGSNAVGQLGLGHNDVNINTQDPVIIPRLNGSETFIVNVYASYCGSSFALSEKGVAFKWGADQVETTEFPVKDSYNNIINFENASLTMPQPVPIPITSKFLSDPVESIHPGFQFVLVVTKKKDLYGWGRCQMLGKGVIENAHFSEIKNLCNPIPLGFKDVKSVSVGLSHCLVLTNEQKLFGWGDSSALHKDGKGLIQKPEVIREKLRRFVCGPDFSILEIEEQEIEVIGRADIFKSGRYKLPCLPTSIVAGSGVIMVKQ